MKKMHFPLLISAAVTLCSHLFAASPEIKLTGRADRVLTLQVRTTVLEVAHDRLYREDGGFLAQIAELGNPYVYEVEAKEAVVLAPVVYDDASILEAIASSFSKQVRGTLARGAVRYLQLRGGGSLQSGSSFPAKLPELEGQSFVVTIEDVTSRGYTLKMRDTTLVVPFNASSGASIGAVRD